MLHDVDAQERLDQQVRNLDPPARYGIIALWCYSALVLCDGGGGAVREGFSSHTVTLQHN